MKRLFRAPLARAGMAAALAAATLLIGFGGATGARAEFTARSGEISGQAAGDLSGIDRGVVLGLLSEERSKFAALLNGQSRDSSLRGKTPMRVEPATIRRDRTPRAALNALSNEDADTLAAMTSARSQILPDMMATDFGGAIDLSEIMKVETGSRGKQWQCLTEALYFEARGESLVGQVAVAEVILNRVDAPEFPDTVCGVVRQGSGKLHACQFSFYCDGKAEEIANRQKWEEVGKVAWVMLQGKPRILTGSAVFYHNTSVKPGWTRKLLRTARIGSHVFYRDNVQLTSR